MLTRRIFMLSSAAVSVTSKMIFAAERSDVIVIGGGLSGLHAAATLIELGFRPLVLEAHSRAGGRVKTADTSDGRIELSASQVGRGYARVIAACEAHEATCDWYRADSRLWPTPTTPMIW